MNIEDISRYDVLEFIRLLEVYQRSNSQIFKFTKYEVRDDGITVSVFDENGVLVNVDLNFKQALINGEATNDSVMWNAYLVHKFGAIYTEWLRSQKMQEIDMCFMASSLGNPYSFIFPIAAILRSEQIKMLDDDLARLELLSQHLFEAYLDDKNGDLLARRCPLVVET